jgi:hypothetical protein
MRIVETEWWTIALPEEWEAEEDDGSVIITDTDRVSEIQISALRKDEGELSKQDLLDLAEDLLSEGKTPQEVRLAGFKALLFEYQEQGEYWREWYTASADLLLFITHCCDLENRGMDDSAVAEILGTLSVKTV